MVTKAAEVLNRVMKGLLSYTLANNLGKFSARIGSEYHTVR
jgi:hypothetical protein